MKIDDIGEIKKIDLSRPPVKPAPQNSSLTEDKLTAERVGGIGEIKGAGETTETEKPKRFKGFLGLKLKKPKKLGGQEKPQSAKKRRLPKWLKIVLLVFAIAGAFLAIQAVIVFPSLAASVKKISNSGKTAYDSVKNQDLVTAGEELKQIEGSLGTMKKKYQLLATYRFIPGLSNYYQDGAAGIEAARAAVKAAQALIEAITPYADVLGLKGKGTFAGGTTEDRIAKIIETIDKVTPQLDVVIQELGLADQSLARIDPNRYPEAVRDQEVRSNLVKVKAMLAEGLETLKDLKPGLEVLPALLGHPDPRTYLVLFQNDTEKRATGGFLTAYASLFVDAGKVKAEKSEDIYSLDAKFKKRLAPPDPIKNYHKNVSYFYLRDMNLSPDFKSSMDLFRTYYDEIPGEPEVVGVIAVDTRFLTRLVELLGPIDVPGYGEFTADNDERCDCPNVIYQLELIADEPTHFIKEDRKGVLGPLMQQIMHKALTGDKQLWPKLFADLWLSLKEKNVLLYFDNAQEQQAAEAMGFAGRVKEVAEESDYFFLVDSNFGGAKSDLYIEQTVKQGVQIAEDGRVEKTVTVEYKNPREPDNCNLERKSGLCLNGLYRDWVRLYVPKGSELIEILGSEVEEISYEESGKTVFEAFYGDESPLRPLGKTKLVFRYRLPMTFTEDYQLYVQKQPGSKPFKYEVNLNGYPHSFNLDQDKELSFEF